MKKSLWLFFATALILSLLSSTLLAQDDSAEELGKNEFTVWGGFSPDSSTAIKATGRTPDVRYGTAAFRYARRFNNNDTVNLKYTLDVIPVAVINYPDIEVTFPPILVPPTLGGGTPPPTPIFTVVRKTAYAFGVAPLGIQANFRPRKKLQPFVGMSGGLLYFNKEVPNELGTRFTFTADLGGGVEYRLKNKKSITFGYKYHHISNGQRGDINPGFDNNLFYIGYTFFSK